MSSGNGISASARWLALVAALLGWMFDGFEMGLFSLVGRPAVADLLGIDPALASPEENGRIGLWFSIIISLFLVGAATGGVLFGWLGDRIGRVRAMALSVLTYALFTGLCGVVNTPLLLGLFRFLAALGMGGEWSLGVALVMEVWPNRSRAWMAGLIGAAANVGYLLVPLISLFVVPRLEEIGLWLSGLGLSQGWVDQVIKPEAKGWRALMLVGALPAVLTFFIRLFVPESRSWQHEKERGATSQWALSDLLAVLVGLIGPAVLIYTWAVERTTVSPRLALEHDWPRWLANFVPSLDFKHTPGVRILLSTGALAIVTLCYLFPAIRFRQRQVEAGALPRHEHPVARMLLAACISGVALLGTWASTQWAPSWADQLTHSNFSEHAKEYTLIWLSLGAITGTMGAAWLGEQIGRRAAYSLLCVSSLISVLVLFQGNARYGIEFLVAAFAAGVCTAGFYGWLPLYLPELFRTRMRATGQGFSFNFGRIIAAAGTLPIGNLMTLKTAPTLELPNSVIHLQGGYPLACSAAAGIYLVGLILIWLAPETKGKPLPD
jgi:MFS family permease